jgi:hypothetical protein
VDEKYPPQVTFLGKRDEWMKKASKYKYLYEKDTEIAYDWLQVWVDANHPSFKNCIIDMSDNLHDGMNHVAEKIIEEAIMTTDPDIIGVSSLLDAEDEENSEVMCNIDLETASPYTIHTVVLPKPSLIDANINSAISWIKFNQKMMIPMKMIPIMRLYPMRIIPETDHSFQCHVNQMSQLLNVLTTKH